MANLPGPETPRSQYLIVIATLAMIAVPAAITLHTAKVTGTPPPLVPNPSPYGYTVSLLLFVIPILVIGCWFVPHDKVKISVKSFAWTIGILFPMGALLDFFFASSFLSFPNPRATLGWMAPALGHPVPIEEYVFYFTGFIAVLLIYIWFDEYWLAAYSIPNDSEKRLNFDRLLRFHPQSLILAVILIAGAIAFKHFFDPVAGFPGYFTFLVLTALLPSSILFPEALPVINWRALSLTLFVILLTSLLWEATLAMPYGWWNYQHRQMAGLYITAWYGLPIEAVAVWIAVTYATVIVYEIVKRWKASDRGMKHAFLGR